MMNNKMVFFFTSLCLGLVCLMVYFYALSGIFSKEVADSTLVPDMEMDSSDPMTKTLKRIQVIQDMCGDLCDTTKEITPGEFMGSITAKVDCQALFKSPVLYQPGDLPPQSWGMLPKELQEMYSYGGRVDVHDLFMNTAYAGEGRNEATVFSKEVVQNYIDAWLAGTPADNYVNGSNIVEAAADYVDVAGKTVLVMGTQDPWLEAVLLSKKPKKVVTVEYGYFISEYPGYSFIRPREFRERYLNGTLDTFDVIFTYSSLEHSGQGRYGDPLNPWGDMLAVAEAWCVSKKDAVLAIGVPTMVSRGGDINAFNAHRIYGPVMYPFLTTNWQFIWPTRDEDRVDPNLDAEPVGYHPVFVFEKTG